MYYRFFSIHKIIQLHMAFLNFMKTRYSREKDPIMPNFLALSKPTRQEIGAAYEYPSNTLAKIVLPGEPTSYRVPRHAWREPFFYCKVTRTPFYPS